MVRDLITHNAPINVFEAEHGGSPLAWALHGSLHSWEREKGDYLGVTRALLIAGAVIPRWVPRSGAAKWVRFALLTTT